MKGYQFLAFFFLGTAGVLYLIFEPLRWPALTALVIAGIIGIVRYRKEEE